MRTLDDPDLDLIDGVCRHCRRYDELLSSRVVSGEAGLLAADQLAETMRSRRNGAYDCLIGVSGGVDSTYVALRVKGLGLTPLAVHVDNGWNSELAVGNIERTLRSLDIDLVTEVLDLDEFYDLQLSFLLASTPDGDVPSDHAIQATLWKVARRHNIKYIISGMNFKTESISVPSWSYGHSDWRYIRGVHSRFGRQRIKSFPHFGFLELFYTNFVRGVRIVSILNYLDYDKDLAMQEISEKLGWQPYGGKHYESIYTRYFQGYVLPKKFGIDKRRGHLSDAINAGAISRERALLELDKSDYDPVLRRRDEVLFRKKLGVDEKEWRAILEMEPTSYASYPNSYTFVQFLRSGVNWMRSKGLYPR